MKHYRRVAIFTLIDKNNRLLLQHRTKDAKFAPNLWGFFGGGIEEGESPEEALSREANEELGITLKDMKFFKRYEFQETHGLYEKSLFIGKLTYPIEQLRKQQKEGQDLGLFSIDEIENMDVVGNDKTVLREIFDSLKKGKI